MRSFITVILFSVVAQQLVLAHMGAPSCIKPDEKFKAIMDTCHTKIGGSDHGEKSADQFSGKDASKCMPLCLLTESKALDSKGDIIDDVIAAQMKAMAEQNGKSAASFVTAGNDCLTTARKAIEADGGIAANPCKFAATFGMCVHKALDQLCQSS